MKRNSSVLLHLGGVTQNFNNQTSGGFAPDSNISNRKWYYIGMLTTPHALVGATIAVFAPHPIFAIPLSIGSHFLLDTIPHWQETLYPYNPSKATWIRIPIDITISVVLVYVITKAHPTNASLIWLSAAAANIPDLDSITVVMPRLLKNTFVKNYWDWHCKIQRETSSLLGLIPQILLSFFCLYISLIFARTISL